MLCHVNGWPLRLLFEVPQSFSPMFVLLPAHQTHQLTRVQSSMTVLISFCLFSGLCIFLSFCVRHPGSQKYVARNAMRPAFQCSIKDDTCFPSLITQVTAYNLASSLSKWLMNASHCSLLNCCHLCLLKSNPGNGLIATLSSTLSVQTMRLCYAASLDYWTNKCAR